MSHTTQILLLYCCILSKAITPISRENQIKPRQLHLNSNDDEISTPNSPLTGSSFEEDCIISATSRKRLNIFPDDSPDEQSIKTVESIVKQESVTTCSSHTPIPSKKQKFVKTEDDAIPLPDPFPLPKHYRADVEVALASGKMTKETMSAFLSAVAAAMLVYKRYPTREDYICVARSVVQKYSFMASPAGTPYVSSASSLGVTVKITSSNFLIFKKNVHNLLLSPSWLQTNFLFYFFTSPCSPCNLFLVICFLCITFSGCYCNLSEKPFQRISKNTS